MSSLVFLLFSAGITITNIWFTETVSNYISCLLPYGDFIYYAMSATINGLLITYQLLHLLCTIVLNTKVYRSSKSSSLLPQQVARSKNNFVILLKLIMNILLSSCLLLTMCCIVVLKSRGLSLTNKVT